MCPIYAVLAAPLARPLGTKVFLWYAHWNRTQDAGSAVRASNLVLSVDQRSVPVTSAKVVGIGHGIDVSDFTCAPAPPARPFRLAALGRYSAAKGLDSIIRAVARVRSEGLDVELHTHGTASSAAEAATLDELRALVSELGVAESVELGGPIPRTEIPALLVASHALVNNMRPGAPDKVVYEAAAACRPVIVSNPVFDELLDDLQPPLRFAVDDVDGLAARITAVGSLDSEARGAIGTALRERVLARHSVDSWADAVVRLSSGSPSAER